MSELGLWLDEQRAALESRDCGRSEEATETLLKKLERVEMEVEQQRKTVERLQESGASLQHLGHPERSDHITLSSAPFSLEQVLGSRVMESQWGVNGDGGAGAAAAARLSVLFRQPTQKENISNILRKTENLQTQNPRERSQGSFLAPGHSLT